MKMDQERLKEVLKDEAFVKELLAMEKPEQVQDALEDKGIKVTTDEIRQMGEFLKKVASGEIPRETVEAIAKGELSEAELEKVAGGFLPILILGAVIGTAFAAGLVYMGVDYAIRHEW